MKMHIYELKITIYQPDFHSIFRSSEALSIPQRINNRQLFAGAKIHASLVSSFYRKRNWGENFRINQNVCRGQLERMLSASFPPCHIGQPPLAS